MTRSSQSPCAVGFEYDEDGEPYTAERLAAWLDAKYRRHGEPEDQAAANFIRHANAALASRPLVSQPAAASHGFLPKELNRATAEELSAYAHRLASRDSAPQEPEQAPIQLNVIRRWPEGFEARLQHVWLDVVSFIPSVKLWDLQRTLAEFGFRMEVYEAPVAMQEKKNG